ncbi:hypothetical protein PIB30_066902 [Stylosanthes scabra]|uniref:F-box associated domain-containing protein n=1 Tax=Stylosanthes scabra TaxID=79078 RepID=A0ABU6YNS7_9FABA|nr:hypothetical protein [Stylosanthes scabra]
MDEIIENAPPLPTLPDDLIVEVFARADGKTVGRGRTLSTFWRDTLVSDEFVYSHLIHTKARSTTSFVHFGMKGPRAIGSWVIRFNADSGNREQLKMPFFEHGNIALRYVSGNIALRYVSDGMPPGLIVWNPTTSKFIRIDDPMRHAVILQCKAWETEIICPIYVQVLDPRYVVHKGEVYWISWNSRGVTRPQCIIRYSPRAEGGYKWLLWIIDEEDGAHSWRLWTEYFIVGPAEYPECFSGEEIIAIKETDQQRNRYTNVVGTRINIYRVNANSNTRRPLQFEAAPFPFHVNSLTLNVESIAPVEGSHA